MTRAIEEGLQDTGEGADDKQASNCKPLDFQLGINKGSSLSHAKVVRVLKNHKKQAISQFLDAI